MRFLASLGAAGGAFTQTALIVALCAANAMASASLVLDSNTVADPALAKLPTLSTQDYFEVSTPNYNYTGPLLLPRFRSAINSQDCTLAFNQISDNKISPSIAGKQYHASIIGVSWEDAVAAKCKTYAQVIIPKQQHTLVI
jgi:hypothetical protein